MTADRNMPNGTLVARTDQLGYSAFFVFIGPDPLFPDELGVFEDLGDCSDQPYVKLPYAVLKKMERL